MTRVLVDEGGRAAVRKAALVLGFILAAFFIIRAIAELLAIDYSDPSSYSNDWGGPGLLGVLLVHCLPGMLAAFALVIWWRRRRLSSRS